MLPMPMDGLTDRHYPDTWKFSLGDLAAPELWRSPVLACSASRRVARNLKQRNPTQQQLPRPRFGEVFQRIAIA